MVECFPSMCRVLVLYLIPNTETHRGGWGDAGDDTLKQQQDPKQLRIFIEQYDL